MAKTSAVQKNLKRIKLVKKYAKKRAALKKIINNKKLELSERFEAQLKLNKLPKNSSKIRETVEILTSWCLQKIKNIQNCTQDMALLVKFQE